MQQAGAQTVDPNLLLTLARDNKAADLIRLVKQQGVPVNLGNKVCTLFAKVAPYQQCVRCTHSECFASAAELLCHGGLHFTV